MTPPQSNWGLPPTHPVPREQRARMGVYLHVPFCPHICPYCDFVKTSRFSRAGVGAFLESALASARVHLPRYVAWARAARAETQADEKPWATLYFGGGTPGLFDASSYAAIVAEVRTHVRLEEFTIETNPYANSERRFEDYAALGVDRITLGAQSLCASALTFLGRKHTPEDVLRSLAQAREAGLAQIQADLIYGLVRGVRTLSVREEVLRLAEAGATGISAYALTLEERTVFARRADAPTDDDVAADEYAELLQACAEAGFAQRETSNFSSYPSRHNNIYWYGLPYLGLGTGAHGLFPPAADAPFGTRYRVGAPPSERAPGDDALAFENDTERARLFALEEEPARDAAAYLSESIFTLLRTPTGLPEAWLAEVATPESRAQLRSDARIARGIESGVLTWDENGLRIAPAEKIRGDGWCAVCASALVAVAVTPG